MLKSCNAATHKKEEYEKLYMQQAPRLPHKSNNGKLRNNRIAWHILTINERNRKRNNKPKIT